MKCFCVQNTPRQKFLCENIASIQVVKTSAALWIVFQYISTQLNVVYFEGSQATGNIFQSVTYIARMCLKRKKETLVLAVQFLFPLPSLVLTLQATFMLFFVRVRTISCLFHLTKKNFVLIAFRKKNLFSFASLSFASIVKIIYSISLQRFSKNC